MGQAIDISTVDLTVDHDQADRALRELPFVNELTTKGTPFWDIDPTGDAPADLHLGLVCGELALAAAKEFDSPLTIATIMRDMVRGGRFGMVEAGFVSVIVCAAKVGTQH